MPIRAIRARQLQGIWYTGTVYGHYQYDKVVAA